MEDQQAADQSANLFVRRIPSQALPAEQLPDGFAPLKLLVKPGGLCIELGKPEVLVGRHSSAEMRLPLPDVSRRHCRFRFVDSHWEIVDLGSLNGIHVNGERLQLAVLQEGDTIRVGGLTFVVQSSSSEVTAPPQEQAEVVWRQIIKVLPSSKPGATQEYRKAS